MVQHVLDRASGVFRGLQVPAHRDRHERSHRLRVGLRELRIDDDDVAVEVQAVLDHADERDVLVAHASRLQVEERRERVASDGVHPAGREHVARRETGVAHRVADDLDGHVGGVDAVRPRERVPLRVGAVRRRGAENLAFQVLRRGHAQRLAADDRERRLVIDHHDGGGEEVGVPVPELDERVDVRGAQVPVAAVGHPRDRLPRAHSGVHGDVEAGLGVPAAVERHQQRRGLSLPFPVVPEPDARRRRGGPGAEKGGQHPKWQAHGSPPFCFFVVWLPHLAKCPPISHTISNSSLVTG